MTGERRTADRFGELVNRRLLPGLGELGFGNQLPGSLVATEAQGVVWLLDIDVAPWSDEQRVCFTIRWGAHVPGLDEVVGDPAAPFPTVDASAVHGRLGQRGAAWEPTWFELRSVPRVVAGMADAALAHRVLGAITRDVVPTLLGLSTPVEVQRHLHTGLVSGRGAADGAELQTIRRIAALSLLLGDRANAARWLDHLELRSAAAMAPDLVSERLAPLRVRIAS